MLTFGAIFGCEQGDMICGKHYSSFLHCIIEFLYRILMIIAGNYFREESICCQILGLLNLIDLFPYWEQTG